ncbi:50S ribosomal protein L28 [Patescibacteria group bacterium]|nr:50S ribosomal protein L28 [Patescibacteria group bacterium]MCG2701890.1 50S ribosomal protein L28 [Candidatus Parcubacteria bacterium]MBU4264900.1 50S ribosomal protein L28 [Patescibacteria group bacterium]MBU4389926.1 50S ribosomal protein L28 [Patescibacteria group bacterium]MBU4396807.1 50S ribosomal protein L28 [Patescibacteria group bacterium]
MRKCDLCDKKTNIGRNRSHAQNRSSRTFRANIQKITLLINGKKLCGKFCTKCIKRLKLDMKDKKLEDKKAKTKVTAKVGKKQESKKVESKKK